MVERNEKGQFVVGHPGGPGRKSRVNEEELVALIKTVVPDDRLRRIIEAVAKRAERGDMQAVEWLFNRLFGKVKERTELTGEDGGVIPLELFLGALKKVYGKESKP